MSQNKINLMHEQTIIEDLGPSLRESANRPNNRALKATILHMYKNSNRRNSISGSKATLGQSTASWTCQLCRVQCGLDELQPISKCQHVYCVTCAKAYLQYRIKAREPIRCLEETCNMPLTKDSPHFQSLTAEEKKKYEEFEEFETSKGNPMLFLCKRHNCASIVSYGPDKDSVMCPECSAVYCNRCLYFKHQGPCQFFDPFFFEAVDNPLHPSQVQLPSRVMQLFQQSQQPPPPQSQYPPRLQVTPPNGMPRPPPSNGSPRPLPYNMSQSQVVSGKPLMIPMSGQPPPYPMPAVVQRSTLTTERALPPAGFTVGEHPPSSVLAIPTEHNLQPNTSRVLPVPPAATNSMRHPPIFARNPPQPQSHKKCTWKEVLLWICLPITAIIVAIAMLFALIAEFFMAVIKGAGNFIGQNMTKAQSTCAKVFVWITIPFQALIGGLLAPVFLKNDQSYKFGEYTKVVWHYAQKLLPTYLRHCCGSSTATTTS